MKLAEEERNMDKHKLQRRERKYESDAVQIQGKKVTNIILEEKIGKTFEVHESRRHEMKC